MPPVHAQHQVLALRLWPILFPVLQLARAWGNRGNARSRQGKLLPALTDYNTAIAIAPYAVDPVLNRGIVMEALNRFDEACQDYRAVLAVDPNDPAAWNNLVRCLAWLALRGSLLVVPLRSFTPAPSCCSYHICCMRVSVQRALMHAVMDFRIQWPILHLCVFLAAGIVWGPTQTLLDGIKHERGGMSTGGRSSTLLPLW